jgi:carbon monoxide dehydrogenase subunit G
MVIDPRSALLILAMALTAPAAAAPAGWAADPAVERRLAAREVVIETPAIEPGGARGRVRAAILIRAPAETVWGIMTDCRQTLQFVPGLKGCRRIGGDPQGRWEDIEHEVHYSWLLPTVRYVLRAEYDRPHRIDFRRLSGDLRDEHGSWLLTPEGAATLVQYDVSVDPGFWIPQALVIRSLKRDLPAALTGLRERAEKAK